MATNLTRVCTSLNYTSSSIWVSRDHILGSPTILLMLQLILVTSTSRLIEICLRPLGQTCVVSHILAGMIFGPSLLGRKKEIGETLFPVKSNLVIGTLAAFGNTLFHFLVSVQTDPIMMVRPQRTAMIIGTFTFLFTAAVSVSMTLILKRFLAMDSNLQNSIVLIGMSQAFVGFPAIISFLNELRMQNTDMGRLAIASSLFSDLLNISVAAVLMSMRDTKGHPLQPLWSLLSTVAFLLFIVWLVRPTISWLLKYMPAGKPVDQEHIVMVFFFILVFSLISEIIGQHYLYGPLIFGLIVPNGPPLGEALASKLDVLVNGLLYPIYLANSGLQTNIFKATLRSTWILGLVFLFGFMIRMVGAILPALYCDVPIRDAFVLALILNVKGILEMTVYNLWMEAKMIHNEEFTLCVIFVVINTILITPLIVFLNKPSRQYHAQRRSTIQHMKRESELRLLVCIHNQESVPTILDLLEVSHATEDNPLTVIAVILVELVGRNAPVLLANQSQAALERQPSMTGRIVNALRQYECNHEETTTVQSFTSISRFETMHVDICRLAADKRATIVIMPFHRQWAIDGSVGSINRSIQNLNRDVLDKAPCSVGILVDRGSSLSVTAGRSSFDVGVLFIGGPDDAESLAYGSRMASHEMINVTVVQILLFGSENSKDRKRDSDLINEYRQANIGNQRFMHAEEVVRDGVELSTSLRKMVAYFDLILVGKYHPGSLLFAGLADWSECPELGVIGDMLASPDFRCTASVLVIQQQRTRLADWEALITHDVGTSM